MVQKASQPKPLEVLPHEGNQRLLVDFGRWIMRTFFHGNMNHSLLPIWIVVSVIAAGTGYFSIGRIYLDPTSFASSTLNAYIELAYALTFLITLSFGGGVLGISRYTKCPECHQNFMFTRKRRRIVGQGTHRGNQVTNYKSDWSCDNCGYTEKNVPEVVERQIPED